MTKLYSFTPDWAIYLFGGLAASFFGLLLAVAINTAFGTQTVIETHPGTKSVCAQQQFNYSLKVTQCIRYQTVPAVCKKTEHAGPVFDTFVSETCE